jgi:hypothetical protein
VGRLLRRSFEGRPIALPPVRLPFGQLTARTAHDRAPARFDPARGSATIATIAFARTDQFARVVATPALELPI